MNLIHSDPPPGQLDAREGALNHVPAAVLATAEAACDSIHGLVAMIRRTDNLLVLIDRTLRVSQPPIARKLGIRFWIPTTGAARVPVLVSWRRVRNHRWRAARVQRLSAQHINRAGPAALCADATLRLASAANDLIRFRATLVHRLHMLRQSASRARNRYGLLDHAEATVIAEHANVMRRLEDAGYTVDERAKHLTDQYLE